MGFSVFFPKKTTIPSHAKVWNSPEKAPFSSVGPPSPRYLNHARKTLNILNLATNQSLHNTSCSCPAICFAPKPPKMCLSDSPFINGHLTVEPPKPHQPTNQPTNQFKNSDGVQNRPLEPHSAAQHHVPWPGSADSWLNTWAALSDQWDITPKPYGCGSKPTPTSGTFLGMIALPRLLGCSLG